MSDTETINIIREAVADWRSGKLSSVSCCMVVAVFTDPKKELSGETLEWARSCCEKYQLEKYKYESELE